jgi:hypothetical protein
MANEDFEMDEWGGEKPKPGYINMLGCASPGCKATFSKANRRTAHIEMMHPGENSGPSPDMIQLARIRPEMAKSLGMTEEEAFAPQNIHEFNQQQRDLDTAATQRDNEHVLRSHPIFRPLSAALSHVASLQASALATAPRERHDRIREQGSLAHEHLLQFGYAQAIGRSVHDEYSHFEAAGDHLDNLDAEAQHGMTHWDDSTNERTQKLMDDLHRKAYGYGMNE